MFKVFKVEGGWEVFWCPSAPRHYQDKIPHDGKVYTEKSAAYRRVAKLKQQLKRQQQEAASEAA